MASEKAVKDAFAVYYDRNPFMTRMDHRDALLAALDAAAAVDGDPVNVATVTAYECGFEAGKEETAAEDDAQWNAVCDEITKNLRELFQPCRAHDGRKRAYNSGVDDALSVVDSMRRG